VGKPSLSDLQAELIDAESEVSRLRQEHDEKSMAAILGGADAPARGKTLVAADDRARALVAAVAKLTAEQAELAETGRQTALVVVRDRLAMIHRQRQDLVDLGTAIHHLGHRIMAAATGNATGGGVFHGRIQHCALVADWPKPVFSEGLKLAQAELIELKLEPQKAAREVVASAADIQVRRTEVRSLSNRILAMLAAENIIDGDLLKPIQS